jgi:hypothetical protein
MLANQLGSKLGREPVQDLVRRHPTWFGVERRADPDNWPIAGSAAELDSSLPEAELNETGEVVIGGQRYAASQRVSALRDLRGDSSTIALHLRLEMSLAQVRALLGDVRKSGATRVAVVARAPQYPWDRKVYWIADGTGTQTGLRPTDSLQLLLHAVDAVAGPGTIARVDGSGSRSECKPAIGSGIVATGGIYGLCDRGSRHCSDGDARQEPRPGRRRRRAASASRCRRPAAAAAIVELEVGDRSARDVASR